jgi:DNA-directed RNA polymerase subunit RPC12/RpoP
MEPEATPTERLQKRLRSGARCPRCRFDLKKLQDIRCPECGFVLAAELIPDDGPRTLNLGLWLHRVFAAAAAFTLIGIGGRYVNAKLNFTPPPGLRNAVPLIVVFSVWLLSECANAFLPPDHKRSMLRFLLSIISALALCAAWWWL